MIKKLHLKSLLLIAALLVGSSSAWAVDQTIEITFSNFSNTSYNADESTFTQDGFTFGYINAMRNGSNGTPSGWAKDQVIQTKSGGYIYNKSAISGLKNIRVYIVANTNSFTVTSGTSSKPTTNSVTRPTTATGTQNITYTKYENKTTTENQTTTATYYDFAVANDYFQIAPGGSLYIWKIVLTYDSGDNRIDPTLSFPQASYSVNLGEGFTAPTLSRDADGTGAVTYSSSKTSVATVDQSTGAITVKGVGSTTITASVAADNKYKAGSAQYVLNVLFAVTDGVFDFEKAGAESPLIDYGSGVTLTSNSSTYVTENKTWTAGNVTMVTSGKYRWWNNDKTLRFYDTSYMEFSVPNNYVITKIAHTGGTFSNPTVGTVSNGSWVGASQTVNLQVSSDFKNITVTYTTVSQTATVQTYGWATYIPQFNLQFAENTAYVVTEASVANGLTLAAVTTVPAGTPLLLKGAGEKTATVVAIATAPTTNLLSVCNGTIADGNYAYVLAKDGTSACFKQWTGEASVLSGRVVLLLNEQVSTRSTYELDDEMTGITGVNLNENQNDNRYYDLQGRPVAQPTKGLYIVNGKKIVVK